MINVITIPQGTASATEQELVVEITESLCNKVCVNAGGLLSGTVSFTAGTPKVLNGTAVFPITATGSIVVSGHCGGCSRNTVNFAETFELAMQTTTDNDLTLTPGSTVVTTYADVSCCHTNKAKLMATLTATIA